MYHDPRRTRDHPDSSLTRSRAACSRDYPDSSPKSLLLLLLLVNLNGGGWVPVCGITQGHPGDRAGGQGGTGTCGEGLRVARGQAGPGAGGGRTGGRTGRRTKARHTVLRETRERE